MRISHLSECALLPGNQGKLFASVLRRIRKISNSGILRLLTLRYALALTYPCYAAYYVGIIRRRFLPRLNASFKGTAREY